MHRANKFRGTFALATLIVAGAACLLAPGAAAADTLDQQQTDDTSGTAAVSATQSVAQTFTAGLSGGIDRVDLAIFAGGSGTPTAPLTVEIRDVSGGQPGSSVLASQSVPASSVGATLGFVPINFASPAPVVAGTQYAIVAYSSTSPVDEYDWGRSLGDSYAAGAPYTTGNSPPSGAWTLRSGDQAFKTYVAVTAPTSSLTVSLAGSGSGQVSSSPAGISCPSSCAHSFPNGTSVNLTASPTAGSAFAGWSGACSGTGACTVAVSANRSVTATFTRLPRAKVAKEKIDRKHRKATFKFKATGATGFQCALIKKPNKKHKPSPKPHFKSCKSPKSYRHLKKGKYTFEVRAVSALGAGPIASKSFKIH